MSTPESKRGKVGKVILIGLDGLMPEMLRKFIEEGILPTFAELLRNGAFAESLPSPPCDTPTNWVSIATGAWTGTHGINTFGIHKEGEPYNRIHNVNPNIFPRLDKILTDTIKELCNAEFLWEASERQGKRCILVNYPGGWPPSISKGIVVEGSGPHSSPLCRIKSADLFMSGEKGNINVSTARGWKNVPISYSRPLEIILPVLGVKKLGMEASPYYHVLILDSKNRGYDRIIISKEKDAERAIADLGENELSTWINEIFQVEMGGRKIRVRGRFKFGLLKLSSNGKKIQIYRTPIFNPHGWTYPAGVADELIDYFLKNEAQKVKKKAPTEKDLRKTPFCQVYELIPDHAKGIAETCEYLCKRYDWDLLFTQIHAPDGLNHVRLGDLCPESPNYDPSKAEGAWEEFRAEYKVLDEAVGRIIRGCADDDTVVIIVSDHAALPVLRVVRLLDFFLKKGLIAYKINDKKEAVMDWEKSKIVLGGHPLAQNVWVNLKGRDPHGIVEPGEEYEKVKEEVVRTLLEIRDPENGKCPVALALRKEDAEFLGQWGDRVGDVLYYMSPGYVDDPSVLIAARPVPLQRMQKETFQSIDEWLADVGKEMGIQWGAAAAHHAFLPTAKFAGFSVRGVCIMSGPGIKKNYCRSRPIWNVDIAPTIAYLLGIEPPTQSEGKIPIDMLTN